MGYNDQLVTATSSSAQALATQQGLNSLYTAQIQTAQTQILPLLQAAQAKLQGLNDNLQGTAIPPAPITIPAAQVAPPVWPTFGQDYTALEAADAFGYSG